MVDTIDYKKVGIRISRLRENAGLSQLQLGLKAGTSQQTVCAWENKKKKISLDKAITLCNVFDCDLYYLLYGDDSSGYKDRKKEIAGNITGLSPGALNNLINLENTSGIGLRMSKKEFLNHILVNHMDVFSDILLDIMNVRNRYIKHVQYQNMDIDQEHDHIHKTYIKSANEEYLGNLFLLTRKISEFIEQMGNIDLERNDHITDHEIPMIRQGKKKCKN